jgi:hypothetical protein
MQLLLLVAVFTSALISMHKTEGKETDWQWYIQKICAFLWTFLNRAIALSNLCHHVVPEQRRIKGDIILKMLLFHKAVLSDVIGWELIESTPLHYSLPLFGSSNNPPTTAPCRTPHVLKIHVSLQVEEETNKIFRYNIKFLMSYFE